MPAIIRVMRSGSPQKQCVYKLYSKAEIRSSWATLEESHKASIENNAPYIMCKVRDEGEALTLAVLIMRKTNMPPSCTYYGEDVKLLFISGEYLSLGYDDLKEHCSFIFRIYSRVADLSCLRHDLEGEPLFWYPGTDARGAYENRSSSSVTGMPMGPHKIHSRDIHDHTPPEFAGLI